MTEEEKASFGSGRKSEEETKKRREQWWTEMNMSESKERRLLRSLVDGIARWAAEEDGIPEWLTEAYDETVILLKGGLR